MNEEKRAEHERAIEKEKRESVEKPEKEKRESAEKQADKEEKERQDRYVIEDRFKRDQIKLQQDQLDFERSRNEARVFKLKQYGDAIRNSMSKMGENSPLDFLPFIKNFERLLQPFFNTPLFVK